jgi:hypothetical protein
MCPIYQLFVLLSEGNAFMLLPVLEDEPSPRIRHPP